MLGEDGELVGGECDSERERRIACGSFERAYCPLKRRLQTLAANLKPLNGTMRFAVRRGLLTVNPCSLLTSDERPRRGERRQEHVWSDAEIERLLEAAEALARQPASRYDYTPLLRTALFTGLRLGELLGLRWCDVDLHEGVLHVRRQYTAW